MSSTGTGAKQKPNPLFCLVATDVPEHRQFEEQHRLELRRLARFETLFKVGISHWIGPALPRSPSDCASRASNGEDDEPSELMSRRRGVPSTAGLLRGATRNRGRTMP